MKIRLLIFFLAGLWTQAYAQIETSITVPYTSAASPTFPALLYLPDDYATTGTQQYPLLVFLHGSGESCPPQSSLYNSTGSGGVPYAIEHGQWPTTGFVNPKDGKTYKFIVVSPQSGCNSWSTSGDQLENIIKYLVATYRVDVNRIYGTGLSAGGGGVTEYAAHLDAATETLLTSTRTYKFAAMVPMSLATISPVQSWGTMIASDNVATWGFGDPNNDTYGANTMYLMNFINNTTPGLARFSQFNTGHGPWEAYYNPTYRENFTYGGVTANMNIYEWMLISTRGTTTSPPPPPPTPPTVSAGSTQTVTLPLTLPVTLTGTATAASGHSIASYSWTQTSGAAAGITSPGSAITILTGLAAGSYTFQLLVTDDAGTTATSTVTITVNAAPPTSPPPTAYSSPLISATPPSATIATTTDNVGATYTLTGASLNAMKWTKFSVPGQKKFRLGVLGSSTSAGNGSSTYDSAYCGRLLSYYTKMGILDTMINLAYSGYDIYQAMPTGNVPPSDVTAKLSPADVPDPARNITAMLTYHPDVILINFPSNGYDVLTISEIMQPYQAIYDICTAAGIQCYVTTTQPRQDVQFDAAHQLFLQVVRDSILNRFGSHAIDFYDGVAVPGQTVQIPAYMYGDNIHFNDAGHLQLFNLVVGANIFQNLISSSSVIGSPTAANTSLTSLPSGVNQFQATIWDSHMQAANSVVTVTVTAPAPSPCGGTKYVITPDPTDSSVYITHLNSSYQPGDTLVLKGAFSAVDMEGLIGTSSCPIVIMNQGTQATLTKRLNLDGCQYLKVTGSGSSDQYGIMIQQDPQLRQQSYYAIQINDKSKDVEVERVYMHNVDIGIVCETNESCDNSLNFPNWTLDSMSFHDNRIVGTWNEGMYIGNTSPDNASYDLRPVTCNGVTSYPAPMKNGYTKVYNNIVDSTGRGGIQLANAAIGISEIYGNKVSHNGMNGDDAQGTAISVGLYTRAYIHDNTISCTYTWGIASIGAGATNVPLRIENNTIDSSGYLNAYDLATTSRTVYDPRTEPTVAPVLTWPQSIEIDTRTRLYTTDSPNPGTAVKGQDSTQFWIKNNVLGLKKNTIGINVDDDYSGLQKNGNIICGNVNKGSGTPAVINVVAGINYSNTCSVVGPPTASAGSAQTITLPTNSVTLTGTGSAASGHTITYAWTKVSGGAASISSPSSAGTTVTGLVQGVYDFRLTVTQDDGQTAVSDVTITVNTAATNQPPTANAGVNQTITLPTNSATLTGSGTDPDGTVASYAWTQIGGPSVATFASAGPSSTVVSNLVQGTYTFKLTVTDNQGAIGSATMTVTVNAAAVNQPPVADAGGAQTITLPTSSATLTGSGTDVDGTIAGYAWVQLSGPTTAGIASPAAGQTAVNNLSQGVYTFKLTVTDNQGATGTATVTVTVNAAAPANQPPVANAGINQTITLPVNSATLTGSGTDPDGTIATYAWIQVAGPSVVTWTTVSPSSTTVGSLVQGVYRFQLTVTDNQGATGTATMTVTVNAAAANQPPVANAGVAQNITLPVNSVTLTGSGTDADGTITGYSWIELSGPSTAGVLTPGQAQTGVNNLQQGVYTFQLMVTDNQGATATSTVTVTVNAAAPVNQPPVANAGVNQTITLPVNSATLTGSGTDPDGTIAGYSWIELSGPSTALVSTPGQFQTVVKNLVQGVYTFQLTVTDNKGATGTATMTVTVNAAIPPGPDIAPVANAGPNQSLTAPVTVVSLDGSASYDPDGTIAGYSWVQTSGAGGISIVNANTAHPGVYGLQPGVYTFQLTVTDNQGATGSSVVVITVAAAAGNTKMLVANAGNDTTVVFPNITCSLNGSASFYQGGTIIQYSWSQLSGPTPATIVSPSTPLTGIDQLAVGVYVFQLTVTASDNTTATDTVTVRVISDLRHTSTSKVYPNPMIQDNVNLVLDNPARGKVEVTLYDFDGRLVSKGEYEKESDTFQQLLIFPSLSKGAYLLRVTFESAEAPLSFKLIRQ